MTKKAYFTTSLLEWNNTENTRSMPWKGEKDPYKIWLSEIILQQTRVEQGWPYYERFIQNYPTVKLLAQAPEEEVFRLWQGLGYYARCKNMLAAARQIVTDFNAQFPSSYHDIQSLKGIGPYTAAAIASFAFNLPHAVLDGNVFRVLARYFNIFTPIDSTAGKKEFSTLAAELLPPHASAQYNQAIMDFGAVICKPQQPACHQCPVTSRCEALKQQTISNLPVKSKKLVIKHRYFHQIVVRHKDHVYLHKRTASDIWQNLHEFFLIETPEPADLSQLLQTEAFQTHLGNTSHQIVKVSRSFKQQLTHQTIHSQFIEINTSRKPSLPDLFPVHHSELDKYAFPKTITDFLTDNSLRLL
ncbi:A/G-specific adenine glycosylase [Chitinophaga pendula]|uniref:A/G-specific adenine glycosylase n=1 Tax=Chitinophaga TaxID=79328 RepID=UPI000BAFA9D7|nr:MULTISPECIES: A/G-specific adenine glycosylase [Chitinophaga]ASZ10558.1 A/G-specific adenine glycosylase [Chitinophaga sp. MD30]UCJ06468.1 A/G-specific adenine glycosylase [Chitinophaga pendula]